MKAVIVESVGETPVYGDYADPVAGPGGSVVAVRAAPLSPIVRALAAGRHYSGGAAGGFIPGVDGVGIDPAGRRVYFLFPKAPFGSRRSPSSPACYGIETPIARSRHADPANRRRASPPIDEPNLHPTQ